MPKSACFYRVTGLVQGVGFRPCVYRIALALNLKGEVFNDAQGVGIYLEGSNDCLVAFEDTLKKEAPPLSRIDSIKRTDCAIRGYETFEITRSRAGEVKTAITPDAAVCKACLTDLFDPENRRYRYAFTNCTHCGPRYTITRFLPYDRKQTSMARFAMCKVCETEYTDPLDRRFHAQPNACPVCGPALSFTDQNKNPLSGDPVDLAVQALKDGKIVAIKGLGGFHLACDAKNAATVARLRERKHRDEKPFALMVANAKSARTLVHLTKKSEALLKGVEHPIVLIEKTETPLSGIADSLCDIGVMLPYTPLHWLLFHTLAGKPDGVEWTEEALVETALVMTSANPSGEPLVTENEEAYRRLKGIADFYLLHNRDIVVGCDDSVLRFVNDQPAFVRRARGYTPLSIKLKTAIPPTLATGPYLKNTAAVSRGNEAFLTQHIGELSNRASEVALEKAVEHLCSILETKPTLLACDAHPDFFSTRLAQEIANNHSLPLYPIYHHAAHVGAVMAELGRKEGTLGLALDGVGLGPENAVWGGELLFVDSTGFNRLAHMAPLALVGADKAAKEPWRMGAAMLMALGRGEEIKERYAKYPFASAYESIAPNPRLAKTTSSLGRYFDAMASLLGLCDIQHDEARAAMLLEAAATERTGRVIEGWSVENHVVQLMPAIEVIIRNPDKAQAAADFHRTLARAISEAVLQAARETGYDAPVALTGGCVINRLLTQALTKDLESEKISVALPRQVPPGDGGLALGELWLAALCHEAGATEHSYRKEPLLCA